MPQGLALALLNVSDASERPQVAFEEHLAPPRLVLLAI